MITGVELTGAPINLHPPWALFHRAPGPKDPGSKELRVPLGFRSYWVPIGLPMGPPMGSPLGPPIGAAVGRPWMGPPMGPWAPWAHHGHPLGPMFNLHF